MSLKSFNVFNENSRFLIFKPIDEIEEDIGWYILRGVDIELRNEIMEKINNGQIMTVKINDEEGDGNIDEKEIFITTSTIYDQNEYSYYSSEDFLDKRLYPDEKIDMMFELLNV